MWSVTTGGAAKNSNAFFLKSKRHNYIIKYNYVLYASL